PRAHRALHSFPTRRSSDLYVGAIQASFAGDSTHSPTQTGPFGSYLVIAQIGALVYAGDFYVADTTGPNLSVAVEQRTPARPRLGDRKSTRLNSSHLVTSYA